MKQKRFTEEQIIGVLKESEAGAKTDDICRRHGISSRARGNRTMAQPLQHQAPAFGARIPIPNGVPDKNHRASP